MTAGKYPRGARIALINDFRDVFPEATLLELATMADAELERLYGVSA